MQIRPTKTTVAALRALLAGADDNEEITFAKGKKEPVPCWCGCGGMTKSRFVPGHDSKYHGLAKRVARGEADEAESLAALPHDESRTEFLRCVAEERPLHARRIAEKAAAKAVRETAKAVKAEVPAEDSEAAEAEMLALLA
jgi:hypothetical protein